MSGGVGRKAFIGQLRASAPPAQKPAPSPPPAPRARPLVAVVGAGYAGLAAASALQRAGVETVVLEARERVGGRVWTDHLDGAPIERGGEFITAGYDATARWAARFGIALEGMGIRYPERPLRPDPGLDPAVVRAAAQAVAAEARRRPDEPASELLARVVPDPAIAELLGSRVQSSRAYPLEGLDARFLAGAAKLVDDEETLHVEGGNGRLAEAIAASLPTVRLGEPVRAVRHGADELSIETDRGVLAADVCIVAIPAPLLRELVLEPALPDIAAAALAEVRMGTAAKLHVPLLEPAAPGALMSTPGRWWAYVSSCAGVDGRVVGAWAGAAPVVDALGAADGPARWLDQLAELWPELPVDRARAVVTTWADDPWAQGAYSVLAPTPGDVRGILEGPHGRVVFAGEHTARDWTATFEGALRSGERACVDVLRILGRPTR